MSSSGDAVPSRNGMSLTAEVAMAARITPAATTAPRPMLRRRPRTMWWRSPPSMRDRQRSMTPIAPEVVQSIATTARTSTWAELARVPTTSRSTSAWTSSGR